MKKISLLLAMVVLYGTSFSQLIQRVNNTPTMLTSVKSKSLLKPINGTKGVIATLNYDAANDDGLGLGQAADFGVYAKHPASVMAPYVGDYITQVEIYINGVTDVSTVEIRLYNDTLTPVFTQATSGLVEGWNTVLLNPSYLITAADLIVGYNITCTGGYPAGNDAGPREANGYGDIMYFSGVWTTAYDLNSSLDGNWNIRATVEDTAITCFPPTALVYSNTTFNSTDIAWTSTSSSWNLKISSTVIDPTTGTGNIYDGSTTTASYSATGLTELTDYYVYIQSDCGSSTTSTWLSSSFSTPKDCSAGITAPWIDDMTAGIDCWSLYDVDGDGFNWYDDEFVTGNYTLNSFSYDNASSTPLTPNNWAVTNKINISNLTTPFLSWTALSFDANYAAEKYSVYVSTTGNTPADFTTAEFTETLVNDAVVYRNVSLAGYSGDIWVAFRHHGVSDMFGLAIDNVKVDNTVSINEATNSVDLAIYPNPANDLLNIKSSDKIVNVRIFNVIGQTVLVVKPNVIHAVLEINNLDDGLYYVEVETETGIKVQKVTVTR